MLVQKNHKNKSTVKICNLRAALLGGLNNISCRLQNSKPILVIGRGSRFQRLQNVQALLALGYNFVDVWY